MRRGARLAAAAAALALAAGGSAAAPGEGEPEPPPRVASIELRLPPGDDRAAAAELVAIERGAPLGARALRRTVQLLFQTGRYRNVLVRAAPVAAPSGERGAWVAVTVEALPVRRLEALQLRVEGPSVLDEERLRAVAGLRAGEPYDDPDGAAAVGRVQAEYARRGYRDAQVEVAASGEAEVTVQVRVRPGAPTRVGSMRLVGDPGAAGAAAAADLRTRPGAVLDEEVLGEDLRRLRQALWAAGHRRARVGTPTVLAAAGGAATVEIPVEAGPRMRFVFRGNEAVPAAELSPQLGFEEGQPVDAPAVEAAADRLRAWYRARGWAAVRVEPEERRRGAELDVVFHLDEGRRYRMGEVRFEGLLSHDAADARGRLVAFLEDEAGPAPDTAGADRARLLAASLLPAPTRGSPPAPLPAGEWWDGAPWDRAAERLADAWRGEGWLEATYLGGNATLDASRGVVEVLLRFREGPLVRVESIAFEGNAALSLPALARESRLAPGDPLSFEKIEATRVAILRLYLARGYLFAHVEHAADREHPAAVRYVVDEGPKVRIGRIVVTGNRRTREDVVQRALSVREGEAYDPDAVAKSQAALLRLGVFRSVGLRLREPEVPQDVKDLAVELSERPANSLAGGAGFSIANGPRATLEFDHPNLMGRALDFVARGKVNYPLEIFRPDLVGIPPAQRFEWRGELGLRQPRLEYLAWPVAAQANAVAEKVNRRAYDMNRVAAILTFDLGITSRAAFTLQYEAEVDQINKSSLSGVITQADLERLRFDEGVTTLHSIRPTIALDYRDNSANPRRGWFTTGTADLSHSVGVHGQRLAFGLVPGSDFHVNMLKLRGTVSGYLPIGPSSTLAVSLQGGRVFPLDPNSRTIVPKRFFLGGATTMRGYAEEEMLEEDVRPAIANEARHCATNLSRLGCTARGQDVVDGKIPISEGGEAFALVKTELRVPLRGSLEAGFFVDVGNLWLDPARLSLAALRTNIGLGLRFVTPVGPAALDLGFNVNPDKALNERIFTPQFTIGLF